MTLDPAEILSSGQEIKHIRHPIRGWFPSPGNAAIQPLDSSARNRLICIGLAYVLCGLRAGFGERSRGEEWSGESGKRPWAGTLDDR